MPEPRVPDELLVLVRPLLQYACSRSLSLTRAAQTQARRAARALAAVPVLPLDAPGSHPGHRARSAACLRALDASVAYAQAAHAADAAYWDALELVQECGWLVGMPGPGADADAELALLWDAVEAADTRTPE